VFLREIMIEDKKILGLARQSIKDRFYEQETRVPSEQEFGEKRGCFVTLTKHGELRGCIGFPYPTMPLGMAIVEAARAAAFQDPRFPPLGKNEFFEIKIEISILSLPEQIKPELKNIEIGKDGLICDYEGFGGLLLPQVATEHKMSQETFLRALCDKAGLPLNSWRKPGFKLWKFQAKIIKEKI